MKKDLVDILACPVCKHHPLELQVERADADEIVEGRLLCTRCDVAYVIEDGIPNLLPPE
ncbi:MAG TPA: methytransferase partner Trm112 [Methanomassiliicoccales archaeon]|nr:methytransferase partner Trm112 [Methanomassiliicoccales archaeon]HPR98486.1 methytransferase partner Trm112 [Methanomassiliicoccales archaeon]HSA34952.1 methytransferase partner Trm112 [Methanomassiliicoccales archaeon]